MLETGDDGFFKCSSEVYHRCGGTTTAPTGRKRATVCVDDDGRTGRQAETGVRVDDDEAHTGIIIVINKFSVQEVRVGSAGSRKPGQQRKVAEGGVCVPSRV